MNLQNEFPEIQPFFQVIISLALGLLVGLQRQWADSPLGGIRTFSLISVLGTVCALLADNYESPYGALIIAMGFLGTMAIMMTPRFSTANQAAFKQHRGLSSEFSMLLLYISGIIVHTGPIWLATAITGMIAVILQSKFKLHKIASRFSEKELKAIMQFVLIALVIFPIIPNRTIDTFQVINPHEIWLMVVLIVGISLVAYIIYKFYGEKSGVLIGGILGGAISSTAATLAAAKEPKKTRLGIEQNVLIILIAWTILYIRIFIEIFVVAPNFKMAWAPLGILFTVSISSTFWFWKKLKGVKQEMSPPNNPAEFKTAFIFAILYSAILLAISIAKQKFGNQGLTVVAILSGMADMDAITLSTSKLAESGKLLVQEAWNIIIIAIISNVFFKGILTLIFGGKSFFKMLLLPWLITLGTGFLLFFFW